jgi:hypothetical protein
VEGSANMDDWKQTKLGPGLTVASWEAIQGKLSDESYGADWETAIAGIEGRFQERFIKPADNIQAMDRDTNEGPAFPEGRGFAIVALDCLLLESLYGYEMGKHTKGYGETKTAFTVLLGSRRQFAKAFVPEDRAALFAAAVRHGLLHDGETRHGWIIRQGRSNGPLVGRLSDDRLVLYRDPFHAAVKAYVAEYFEILRSSHDAERTKRRKAFRARVEELCKESKPRPKTTAT